tara:strand:- start:1162 stop:2430 length:1269 start_codon:yes stop_codon:yes gene_type:complete
MTEGCLGLVGEGSAHAVFRAHPPMLWRVCKEPQRPAAQILSLELAFEQWAAQAQRGVLVSASMSKSNRVSVQEWLGVEFMPRVCRSVLPKLLLTCFETSYALRSGLFVQDVTRNWLPLGPGKKVTGGTFAVELKPKQADKARSWLIDPLKASIKAQFSRFLITQAAKLGKSSAHASNSDHEVLFSGNKASIEKTIRVSFSRQVGPVIGCFVEGNRVPTFAPTSSIAAVVASVLEREPVLKRLRAAQQELDCLDVDGVAVILASRKLVDFDIEALLGCRAVGSKLSAKAKAVAEICRCPPGLFSVVDPKVRQACRKLALSAIGTLDPPDLLDLLHNWLVALALDDVSLVVTATRLMLPTSARHQTPSQMGIVTIKTGEAYAYAIALIDVSPKSPSKLIDKAKREADLTQRASAVLVGGRRPSL